jgi:hypothetical protein
MMTQETKHAILTLALRRLERAGVDLTDPAYRGLVRLLYEPREAQERSGYALSQVQNS